MRIFHHVQGIKHFGVHYGVGCQLELVGFTDFDWNGDSIDINSTSGYVFILEHVPICWLRNKQHTISSSLAKVKYEGEVNATTQCVWLQGIIGELGFAFDSPIVIWCDNQSAIYISTHPLQRQRAKHIQIHMHYIRNLVHGQVISLQNCPSTEKIVDIFTKIFTKKEFTYLRSLLGLGDTS